MSLRDAGRAWTDVHLCDSVRALLEPCDGIQENTAYWTVITLKIGSHSSGPILDEIGMPGSYVGEEDLKGATGRPVKVTSVIDYYVQCTTVLGDDLPQ